MCQTHIGHFPFFFVRLNTVVEGIIDWLLTIVEFTEINNKQFIRTNHDKEHFPKRALILTWRSSLQVGYSFTCSVLRSDSRTILSTYPSHSCSLMSACHYPGLSSDIDCSRQPGTSMQHNASLLRAHYIAAVFLMLLNKLQLWNAFIWSTYSCFPPIHKPTNTMFSPWPLGAVQASLSCH